LTVGAVITELYCKYGLIINYIDKPHESWTKISFAFSVWARIMSLKIITYV